VELGVEAREVLLARVATRGEREICENVLAIGQRQIGGARSRDGARGVAIAGPHRADEPHAEQRGRQARIGRKVTAQDGELGVGVLEPAARGHRHGRLGHERGQEDVARVRAQRLPADARDRLVAA